MACYYNIGNKDIFVVRIIFETKATKIKHMKIVYTMVWPVLIDIENKLSQHKYYIFYAENFPIYSSS